MIRTFRELFYHLAPSWLVGRPSVEDTDHEGEKVAWSISVVLDAFAERTRQSLQARFPSRAPWDAMPLMSRDRKIVRGIGETDAQFAARLLPWLTRHRTRGNPFAMLRELRDYLNADCRVQTVDDASNWFEIDYDGTESYTLGTGAWDWDDASVWTGSGTSWSRFWVIIYPTAAGEPFAAPADLWGGAGLYGGSWGFAGTTWGTTATPEEIAMLRRIVREWKPAGTRCEWIIIAFDDTKFGPAGTAIPAGEYGAWSKNSAGVRVAAREPTARYIAGTDGGYA